MLDDAVLLQPDLFISDILLNTPSESEGEKRGTYKTDGISGEATPVPIPNTAVKLSRVNGSNAQFGVVRVDRRQSH